MQGNAERLSTTSQCSNYLEITTKNSETTLNFNQISTAFHSNQRDNTNRMRLRLEWNHKWQ